MRRMTTTTVLFVCIGNTCRSPMAEAMVRGMAGDRVRAMSAGLAPTRRVAPETVEVLERLGYSGEGLVPRGLGEVPLDEVDVVVSLIGPPGVRWLPSLVGADTVVWNVPDPWGEDEETYLAVARRIEKLVKGLIDDLD